MNKGLKSKVVLMLIGVGILQTSALSAMRGGYGVPQTQLLPQNQGYSQNQAPQPQAYHLPQGYAVQQLKPVYYPAQQQQQYFPPIAPGTIMGGSAEKLAKAEDKLNDLGCCTICGHTIRNFLGCLCCCLGYLSRPKAQGRLAEINQKLDFFGCCNLCCNTYCPTTPYRSGTGQAQLSDQERIKELAIRVKNYSCSKALNNTCGGSGDDSRGNSQSCCCICIYHKDKDKDQNSHNDSCCVGCCEDFEG